RPVPKEYNDQVSALQAEYGYKGNEPPADLSEAKRREYADRNRRILSAVPPATVAQLVDSIEYAVKKIGIDHVGISSDFNHGGGVVGWEHRPPLCGGCMSLKLFQSLSGSCGVAWCG